MYNAEWKPVDREVFADINDTVHIKVSVHQEFPVKLQRRDGWTIRIGLDAAQHGQGPRLPAADWLIFDHELLAGDNLRSELAAELVAERYAQGEEQEWIYDPAFAIGHGGGRGERSEVGGQGRQKLDFVAEVTKCPLFGRLVRRRRRG